MQAKNMIEKWTLFVNRLKFLASCRDSMSAQTHFIGNLALDKYVQEKERETHTHTHWLY